MSDFLPFLEAIIRFARPWELGLMTIAGTLGLVIGALPGLNATLGIALLIGITYPFGAETAMIMIIGLYVGTMYSGAISAVLINIPGTGSAAATCLDGYQMALQGRAVDAIMLSRVGSFLGSLFGVILFVLCAPVFIDIALMFTSAEYFWLCVFGVLVCGQMATPDLPIKGWIAGLVGFMLAFVGLEDLQGYARFTFGMNELATGLPWVPVMIGLFAVPQVVRLIRESERMGAMGESLATLPVIKTMWEHRGGLLKWTGLGMIIGALPGVGENIAAWAAYGMAKRDSKHPEEFGKGAVAGVLAPEVANNSAVPGAILVLLVLGVPGSPPAAVMMGALQIHGIRPGPMLGIDNPTFIYDMAAWMFWATLAMMFVGIAFARPMAAILKVPPRILAPLVAVLCIVGTFSASNSLFDLYVVVISGILGYAFEKYGYHPAPLILGFVLGQLADTSFRRALDLNDGNPLALINRPIAFILFLATAYMMLQTVPAFQRLQASAMVRLRAVFRRGEQPAS
jgi:putative tricarboxylic transport membrane protein